MATFQGKRELVEEGNLRIEYADSRDFTAKSNRLDNAKKEFDLGITTKEKMLRDVNPEYTDEQVEVLSKASKKEEGSVSDEEVIDETVENTDGDA